MPAPAVDARIRADSGGRGRPADRTRSRAEVLGLLAEDHLPGVGGDLVGRGRERRVMDELLDALRTGRSGVLVVHAEPGAGKTALLRSALRHAADCRVASISGVRSEMDLRYAALHQLCRPLLGRIESLPEPQQTALRTAFGLAGGADPDRLLLALAVLGLLTRRSEERRVGKECRSR